MSPLRAVIDANVWVSAAGFPGWGPDKIVDLARAGVFRSILSPLLLEQVTRRLVKPPFSLSPHLVERFGDEMRSISEIVVPDFTLAVITAKESDNRILEVAVAGKADVIVTGDRRHLLPLGSYAGIPIVSPPDFLAGYLATTP